MKSGAWWFVVHPPLINVLTFILTSSTPLCVGVDLGGMEAHKRSRQINGNAAEQVIVRDQRQTAI